MPSLQLSPRLKIHYLDPNPTGAPVVLLLHGLGATGESWGLQTPALSAAGFRVIAPDARSFGRSSYPGGSHTIQDMAADMLGVLDALEITTAHVVGISMGGTLALQLALDAPRRVRKLVLANTFASLRPAKLSVWLFLLLRLVMVHTVGVEAQARFAVQRIFPDPQDEALRAMLLAEICQADPWGYRATMRALGRFNVTRRLRELRCPTLVVTASADNVVPPPNQFVLARQIPGAEQMVIEGAGHAVTATHPAVFNQALLSFLQT
jgi:3-oxoadipate enol-lactonase